MVHFWSPGNPEDVKDMPKGRFQKKKRMDLSNVWPNLTLTKIFIQKKMG